MVEMRIECIKHLACLLVFQLCPGDNASACSIPSHGTFIGSLRQPEIAIFEQLELVVAIVNRHKLTFLLAIVTTDTDAAVVWEIIVYILQLLNICLLQTEHIRLLFVNHFLGCRLTDVPCVVAIIGTAITNIIGNVLYG